MRARRLQKRFADAPRPLPPPPPPPPPVTPGPRLPFPGRVGLCAHTSTRNLSKRKGVARLDICSRERTRCRLHVVFPAMHPRSLRGRTLRHAPRLGSSRCGIHDLLPVASWRVTCCIRHVARGIVACYTVPCPTPHVPCPMPRAPCAARQALLALHGRPSSRCTAGLPRAAPCGRHGGPPARRARGHRRRRLRARR